MSGQRSEDAAVYRVKRLPVEESGIPFERRAPTWIASRRDDGSLRPYVTMWVVHRGGPEPEAVTLETFGREIPDA